MNTISLLSGWSGQQQKEIARSPASSLSRRASTSSTPHAQGNGESLALHRSPGDIEGGSASRDAAGDGYGSASTMPPILGNASSASDSAEAGHSATEASLGTLLKPPEAVYIEKAEADIYAAVAAIDSHVNASDLEQAASAYPTPPATPELHAQNDNSIGLSDVQTAVIAVPTQSLVPPEIASSRALQTLTMPARYLSRIYALLCRFLALFGIKLSKYQPWRSPAHTSVRPANSRRASSVKGDPPSYDEVTKAEAQPAQPSLPRSMISTPRRWRMPLLSRRNGSIDEQSSDSSTSFQSPSSRRPSVTSDDSMKRLVEKPPVGRLIAIPSQPSVAQVALSKPKTLVLDLDETLIHSTSRMGPGSLNPVTSIDSSGRVSYKADVSGLKVRVVEVVLDGRSVIYHVYKRPWVDFFLRKVSKWYTVIVFTASMQEYADPVIDWLDPNRVLVHSRLFRESCTYVNGSYVKDLTIVDADLGKVCLVDNSPISYAKHQANGIPIEGWINDPNDEALLDLLPMLDSLRFTNDVRNILGLRLASTSTVLPSASTVKGRRISKMQPIAAVSESQMPTSISSAKSSVTGLTQGTPLQA